LVSPSSRCIEAGLFDVDNSGRVVFANWLSGIGLPFIVDHGDGFMTLYGYNEMTLKITGDQVAPDDVIATVGN